MATLKKYTPYTHVLAIVLSSVLKILIYQTFSRTLIPSDLGVSILCDVIALTGIMFFPRHTPLSYAWLSYGFAILFYRVHPLVTTLLMGMTYLLVMHLNSKRIAYILGLISLLIQYHTDMQIHNLCIPIIFMMTYLADKPTLKRSYLPVVFIVGMISLMGLGLWLNDMRHVPTMTHYTIQYTLMNVHIIYFVIMAYSRFHTLKYIFVKLSSMEKMCYVSMSLGYFLLIAHLIMKGLTPNVVVLFASVMSLFPLIALYTRLKTIQHDAVQNELDTIFKTYFTKQTHHFHQDHDEAHFWMNFSTKVDEWVEVDGLAIVSGTKRLYQSGIFRETTPADVKAFNILETYQFIFHAQANHQPFRYKDLVKLHQLMDYIDSTVNLSQPALQEDSNPSFQSYREVMQLRKDISYYLHDHILQDLLAVKNIMTLIESDDVAMKDLVVETLGTLNTSIRNQMYDIYPSTLRDLSFEQNLAILVNRVQERYPTLKITLDYQLDGEPSEVQRYYFYQNGMELVMNACKHAQAEMIVLRMTSDETVWILSVSDDGIPFDISASLDQTTHLGLKRLTHDITALNGHFESKSHDQGKTLSLILPKEVL